MTKRRPAGRGMRRRREISLTHFGFGRRKALPIGPEGTPAGAVPCLHSGLIRFLILAAAVDNMASALISVRVCGGYCAIAVQMRIMLTRLFKDVCAWRSGVVGASRLRHCSHLRTCRELGFSASQDGMLLRT